MSDAAIHEICLTVGGVAGIIGACFFFWLISRD
jgi:hypothetical protein